MSDWKVTETPVQTKAALYETEVEGLKIKIEERGAYVFWRISGFLYEDPIDTYKHVFDGSLSAPQAQADALAAARRLLAAGVRGEIRPAPVDPTDTIAGAFAARRMDGGEGGL